MPVVIAHGGSQTPARLFKLCREALGATPEEMQDDLCIWDVTTILKIERGKIDVHGPTWVALWGLLEERIEELESQDELSAEDATFMADLNELQEQVFEYMEAIRKGAGERRAETELRRDERRAERVATEDFSPSQ